MLERFTKSVRAIVQNAEREARALDAPAVGSEHLLLALVDANPLLLRGLDHGPGFVAEREFFDDAAVLRRLIERDAREALAAIGISHDDVRRRIEAEFGEDAWERSAHASRLPFNGEARDALELALRVALETKTRRIGPCELAIALVRQDGRARALIGELGLAPEAVETRLMEVTFSIVGLAGR